MFKEVKYQDYANLFLERLPKGAFLTIKAGDELNTMTIGWGSIGYMWKKPVLMVLVRYSRYSYNLLEKGKEFSVSIPVDEEMKKTLAIAGTKSGRDIDKFEACNIKTEAAKYINSPLINGCGLHFECKVVYQNTMEPATLIPDIKEDCYPNHDYHILYFGEILATYIEE